MKKRRSFFCRPYVSAVSTSHVSRIHVQGVNPSFLGIIADANVGGGALLYLEMAVW